MKYLLLLLGLLLAGCGRQTAPTPPPPALYQPGSSLETRYSGAVRRYGAENVRGIRTMGNDLLLFSGGETTTLTLVTGDALTVSALLDLDFLLDAEDPSIREAGDGISYFDPLRRETVVLDETLTERRAIAAPEDLSGSPILSEDGSALFYCTPNGLRCWDLNSGIRKNLSRKPGLRLTGLALDGTILSCVLPGEGRSMLISAKDGSLLWEGDGSIRLTSRQDRFYLSMPAGLHRQLLFGEVSAGPKLLVPKGLAQGQFLENLHAAAVPTDRGLDLYDLSTGRRSSALDLEGRTILDVVDAGGFVYILCPDALYRWAFSRTPAGDFDNYTGDPGNTALDACLIYARAITEHSGIEILLGREAAAAQPWDYRFTAETQADTLWRQLELLDQALSALPGELLDQTTASCGGLKLCLVRSITGVQGAGSVETANGVQFRDDTGACLALAVGPASVRTLYHELYHVMEPLLLTESPALGHWNSLNPRGFSYDEGYGSAEARDPAYLEGPDRAFVDRYSMTYPKEDRARILESAMTPGNETLFEAPILQEKLRLLCSSIRKTFALTKPEGSYRWEQYLRE